MFLETFEFQREVIHFIQKDTNMPGSLREISGPVENEGEGNFFAAKQLFFITEEE